MTNKFAFFILSLLLLSVQAFAQSALRISKKQIKQVDSVMHASHKAGKFNGLVLVGSGDKVMFSKGFGPAIREQNNANTSTSQFYILSITKLITSTLILKLVEEGKVKLNETFVTYLSHYRNNAWQNITIHHLLTQTSGLPNFNDLIEQKDDSSRKLEFYVPDSLIEVIRDKPLNFKPGEKFEYSNSNHVLLGLVVEKITGKTYAEAVTHYIAKPLKLTSTGYNPANSSQTNYIRGYSKKGDLWSAPVLFNPSIVYSAGGMYSTLTDLYQFQRALDKGKVLKPETLKMMHQPYVPVEDFFFHVFKDYIATSYGYGVFLKQLSLADKTSTPQVMIVGAFPGGFFVHAVRLPEKELYVITLENSGQYFFPNEIIDILTQKN